MLSKLINRFNIAAIKIPGAYIVYIDKIILKFMEIQNSQNNHEKEQRWRTHTFCFKIYYKATVNQNSVALA